VCCGHVDGRVPGTCARTATADTLAAAGQLGVAGDRPVGGTVELDPWAAHEANAATQTTAKSEASNAIRLMTLS
jgi:hypothetical protein